MPFVALRVSRAALSKKSPAFLRIERKKSEEGEREREKKREGGMSCRFAQRKGLGGWKGREGQSAD